MFKSLKSKTVIWASIPVVIMVLVVAALTPRLLEEMARTVAQQRDVELARISAARLSERLGFHSMSLQMIATSPAFQAMQTDQFSAVVDAQSDLSYVFDGGLVVFDSHGKGVWAKPFPNERKDFVFPMSSKFEEICKSLRPIYSDIFNDTVTGEDVILIGVPIVGTDGRFLGVLAGLATIKYSLLGATYHKLLEFKEGRSGYAYLVDGAGRAIYHRNTSQVGSDMRAILPVQQVMARRTGSSVIKDTDGEMVIVGYAPVSETGWGLVTQEAWDVIITPIKHDRKLLLILLVAAGIAANVIILFAVGRILKPIRDLTDGAKRLAEGDFSSPIVATTGNEVQVLAQQFNSMADAVRKSYSELEQRVSERTRDLASAKEKAVEAEHVKSAFIATMSHELRTPLNSIIGFTGMVLNGVSGPLNADQSKQLTKAYNSARHLLSLINDILDLSKIEAGKLSITRTEVDIKGLIQRATEAMGPMAAEKGLTLTVSVSPDLRTISTDERRFEQILLNLVSNAVKFTEKGAVTVTGSLSGEYLQVDVSDTGIGIEPEDIGRLFQTFRQIGSMDSRKLEGTGLGLAICDRLVTMLGGRIWLKSEKQKGSTFSFTLPLRPGPAQPVSATDRGME